MIEAERRLKNPEPYQYYEVLREYLLKLSLNPEIVDEVLQYFVVKHYRKGEYFSFVGQPGDKLGAEFYQISFAQLRL